MGSISHTIPLVNTLIAGGRPPLDAHLPGCAPSGAPMVQWGRAEARPSTAPTIDEATAYLEALPVLWDETDNVGRQALAASLFERIDVLGVEQVWATPKIEAAARGLVAAVDSPFRCSIGSYGRGERHCPATTDLPITMRLAEPPEPCEWLRSA